MAIETRLPVLILDWLRENGPGSGPGIARELQRDPGLTSATLRRYEQEGVVRRVGTEPSQLGGRPAVVYELARRAEPEEPEDDDGQLDDDSEEQVEMDATTNGTGPEKQGWDVVVDGEPGSDESGSGDAGLAAVLGADVDLYPEDMEELLDAFCGELSLAEATGDTLLFVLRMRRVIAKLTEVHGEGKRPRLAA